MHAQRRLVVVHLIGLPIPMMQTGPCLQQLYASVKNGTETRIALEFIRAAHTQRLGEGTPRN